MEPIVSTLLRLTCSVAIVGAHYPVSLYSVVAANVAPYALVGLVVEILRRVLLEPLPRCLKSRQRLSRHGRTVPPG
jgi:hypothetical protein